MNQENDYENYEEQPEEFEEFESDDQVTVGSPGRPDRQVQERVWLLNSLLISLASILAFFVAMWNIVVYVRQRRRGFGLFRCRPLPLSSNRRSKGRETDATPAKGPTQIPTDFPNHRDIRHHLARHERARRQGSRSGRRAARLDGGCGHEQRCHEGA